MKLIEGENARYCSICKDLKHFNNFWVSDTGKYGRYSRCKTCQHKENTNGKVKYYKKCLECGESINPPKRKFCCRNHKNTYNQREKYGSEYTIKYRNKNPKNFIRSLLHKKVRNKLDIDYMMSLYKKQNGKCAISGVEMTYITGEGIVPTNISIDKIDANKDYEKGNVQLACLRANRMKWTEDINDLIYWCQKILKNNSPSNLRVMDKSKNRAKK